MVATLIFGIALAAAQAPNPNPSFVSGLTWMAGSWKSSATEYSLGGIPSGELNKTADVLMGNSNNSLVLRIANAPEKGKPLEPAEMILLHTSTDGKSTKAFGIYEIADEPVKLSFSREGDRVTLVGSCPVQTDQGRGRLNEKTVIEKVSSDRWIYSGETTYTIAGTPITISQKLTFDRVNPKPAP